MKIQKNKMILYDFNLRSHGNNSNLQVDEFLKDENASLVIFPSSRRSNIVWPNEKFVFELGKLGAETRMKVDLKINLYTKLKNVMATKIEI